MLRKQPGLPLRPSRASVGRPARVKCRHAAAGRSRDVRHSARRRHGGARRVRARIAFAPFGGPPKRWRFLLGAAAEKAAEKGRPLPSHRKFSEPPKGCVSLSDFYEPPLCSPPRPLLSSLPRPHPLLPCFLPTSSVRQSHPLSPARHLTSALQPSLPPRSPPPSLPPSFRPAVTRSLSLSLHLPLPLPPSFTLPPLPSPSPPFPPSRPSMQSLNSSSRSSPP